MSCLGVADVAAAFVVVLTLAWLGELTEYWIEFEFARVWVGRTILSCQILTCIILVSLRYFQTLVDMEEVEFRCIMRRKGTRRLNVISSFLISIWVLVTILEIKLKTILIFFLNALDHQVFVYVWNTLRLNLIKYTQGHIKTYQQFLNFKFLQNQLIKVSH